MKILMFGWEFPPSISGGLGTACRVLTEGLVGEGTEIVFVVPGASVPVALDGLTMIDASRLYFDGECTMPECLPDRSFGLPLTPYLTLEGGQGFLPALGNMGENDNHYAHDLYDVVSRYAGCARRIAREDSFDVIVTHDWMAVPAGLAAREESGRPLVVHIHSLESDRSPLRINEYIYGVERSGMHEADRVIAVSYYTKKKIMDQYDVPESKITVIHNAAPYHPAGAAPALRRHRGKIVLFLGRVTRQKGPDFFAEAAERVLSMDPAVRFIMAGSGEMLPTIRDRVEAAGIADRFEFTGFLSGEEVTRVFARSDIYVMPSLSEPFGIAALEAVIHGIPPVLTKGSGVCEVLKSCPIVDYGDVDALAETIIQMLSDEELRFRVLEAAQRDMAGLTPRKQALESLALYRSLINEG